MSRGRRDDELRARLDAEYAKAFATGSRGGGPTCIAYLGDPDMRYISMAQAAGHASGALTRAALIEGLRTEALTVDQAVDSIIETAL